MIPAGHNEKWRRSMASKQPTSQVYYNTCEPELGSFERSFPSSYYPRNGCPKHPGQHFQSANGFDYMPPATYEEKVGKADFHDHAHDSRSYLSSRSSHYSDVSSIDMAKLQLQHLFAQKELYGMGRGLESFFSPPPTISSSRSTVVSCNSAPPFVTHCPSPVASDDYDNQYGSYDSYPNFNFNNVAKGGSTNSYYKKEGGDYEKGTMYTAEDVHTVVKNHRDGNRQRIVSNKVFVGGISHSMNREIINTFFGKFGVVFVDWPVKSKSNNRGKATPVSSYSYLFLVYSEEQSVIKLMKACTQSGGDFFVTVPGCRDMIQIRPWFIENAFYISSKARNARIVDIHRTVFVGGLPRIVTAEEIAHMFSEFGKVLLVTIDIDQDYGYPKGAARVTFDRDSAFNKALEKKYLKFENIDSSKTLIEIKPYVMEDVGCDQCGGLWFNPFLDVYDQLKSCKKEQKKQNESSLAMWSASNPFAANNNSSSYDTEDLISKIDAGFQRRLNLSHQSCQEDHNEGNVENEIETGARKFLELTKSFGLDKVKTVTIDGTEYCVGPDLWYHFLPPPSFEVGNEPVQMDPEQKIESFLRMKRTNVYSNKSSYCKERPCRQYYCPSCSNKLHSGPDQHVLLPAGRPERRPRKDKNMYLVSLNN